MRKQISIKDYRLMNTLGVNLKRIREHRGLTQQEVADSLDVNRVSIARIESGKRLPGLQFVVSVAKLLKCSVDDLTSEPAVAASTRSA